MELSKIKGVRIVLTRAEKVLVPRRRSQPRLLAFPIPIRMPTMLLGASHLQDESYSAQGEPLILPDAEPRPDNITSRLEGAFLMGEGQLVVPGKLAGAPVVWDEKRESQPSITALNNQGRDWYPVGKILLLRRPLSGPSYLIAVESVVALRPMPVDLDYSGLVLICSLDEEGLATDLSGSQVRQDLALEAFLRRTRAALPEWLEAFARGVAAWVPPLGFDPNIGPAAGGGFLGFMSAVAVFGATGVFIFPPLVIAAGAYLGDRAYAGWKKRRIQEDVREILDHRSHPPGDAEGLGEPVSGPPDHG